jgi:hypothetical protein
MYQRKIKSIFILIGFALFTSCAHYEARSGSSKLAWVDSTVLIKQPVDKVWQIVGENFDQSHIHMAGVDNSYYLTKTENLLGSVRRSEHVGGDHLDVKIMNWNPEEKYIRWQIVETNVPMLSQGVGEYRLTAIDHNTTRLDQAGGFRMKFSALDGMGKIAIRKMFRTILAGIKHQSETGNAIDNYTKKEILKEYKGSIEILN